MTETPLAVGIFGAAGRMGRAIMDRALEIPGIRLAALVERDGHPAVGTECHGVRITADSATLSTGLGAAIDFSAPEAALAHGALCAKAGVPLVIGATGIDAAGRERLAGFAREIPLVYSPNMSLSANVLFDLVRRAATLLPGYDVEIAELHHGLKKDAPSGTALRLLDSVQQGRGTVLRPVHGRQGAVGARSADEIGLHALRGGDAVGDHTVYFLGHGERMELTHRATSRAAFATGALAAARWAADRSPGLYDMGDVLGLPARPA